MSERQTGNTGFDRHANLSKTTITLKGYCEACGNHRRSKAHESQSVACAKKTKEKYKY
jgi:hypothetical protein